MTFYEGFVDELGKLAKKEKKQPAARALSGLGLMGMGGGLIAETMGDLAKRQAQEGWAPGDMHGISEGGRPAWSHKARKWGKRSMRVGLPMWLSGALLEGIGRMRQ